MSNQQVVTQRVFGEISDDQIAANEPAPASATTEGVVRADSERVVETKAVEAAPLRPTTMAASSPRLSGNHSLPPPPPSAGGGKRRMATLSAVTPAGPSAPAANASTANRWRLSPAAYAGTNQIVVEGYADAKDGDKAQASLDRANRVREQLIRDGIDPSRVVAVAQGEKAGRKAGVRIVEGQSQETKKSDVGKTQAVAAAAPPEALDPIGASHFESPSAMSIARGTSAMVSIFDAKAEGDVVYLYDPESPRGSKDFAFKAVRLRNPTDSVLESGPVTVFGEGRFIGEGIAEPIPAKSIAFVPFALDRQIVLEQVDGERDEIARVVSVQRGVLATETQHIRRTSFSLHNRMSEPTTVYVKHTVPAGYALTASPKSTERLGTAHLIRVEAPSNGKTTFVIEESTPVTRTIDLRSLVDMDAVRLYLRSNKAIDPLRSQLEALLHLQQEIGNIEQRVQTLRDQMTAYRERMEELHVQIVTLKAVKTGGPMMKSLEKKLQEMSDRLSQATVDVASQQENLLVTRIRLQDGIAELSLEKKAKTE